MWRIIVYLLIAVAGVALFVSELRGFIWALDLGLKWGSGWWSLFNAAAYIGIQAGIVVGIYQWVEKSPTEEEYF
jgi:hypothetical protein